MKAPAFGQTTIFDIPADPNKRRPCEYSFKRYIGQRVRTASGKHGKIAGIENYYTHILSDEGELLVGTPTTTAPEE